MSKPITATKCKRCPGTRFWETTPSYGGTERVLRCVLCGQERPVEVGHDASRPPTNGVAGYCATCKHHTNGACGHIGYNPGWVPDMDPQQLRVVRRAYLGWNLTADELVSLITPADALRMLGLGPDYGYPRD